MQTTIALDIRNLSTETTIRIINDMALANSVMRQKIDKLVINTTVMEVELEATRYVAQRALDELAMSKVMERMAAKQPIIPEPPELTAVKVFINKDQPIVAVTRKVQEFSGYSEKDAYDCVRYAQVFSIPTASLTKFGTAMQNLGVRWKDQGPW